jgi:hypothetical protein
MLLTKLPRTGNNLIIPGQGEFGKWHPGCRRENQKPFLQCNIYPYLYLYEGSILICTFMLMPEAHCGNFSVGWGGGGGWSLQRFEIMHRKHTWGRLEKSLSCTWSFEVILTPSFSQCNKGGGSPAHRLADYWSLVRMPDRFTDRVKTNQLLDEQMLTNKLMIVHVVTKSADHESP